MQCIAPNMLKAYFCAILSPMPKTPSYRNPFIALASWGGSSTVRWHLASLAAGWLSLFVSPPSQEGGAAKRRNVVLAAAILILVLLALGPLLGALSPVLTAAGKLDGTTLTLLLLATLNAWRYRRGRALLLSLPDGQAASFAKRTLG